MITNFQHAFAPAAPVESATRQKLGNFLGWALPTTGIGVLVWGFSFPDKDPLFPVKSEINTGKADQVIVNWSGTHEVKPRYVHLALCLCTTSSSPV